MKRKEWSRLDYAETAPGVMTEDEADANRLEQRRGIYDFLRHLMTLDAGVLVLIATLVEKVFAPPAHRWAIGLSVVAFFVSLMGAGLTYLVLLANAPRAGDLRMTSADRRWYLSAMLATFAGFLVGMGMLAWFFATNWFHW